MRTRYPSDSYLRFLEDLREDIRFADGTTQESIARHLGVDRSTLCRKLRNKQCLTAKELFEILIILGVTYNPPR